MLRKIFKKAKSLVDRHMDPVLEQRLALVPSHNLNKFGVDSFGYSPAYFKYAGALAKPIYDHYFRVSVEGISNIPEGRVMLIANHSGQLPFDAAMVISAVFLEAPRPRVLRAMIERWVPSLPFVSYLFLRFGQIVGDPDSARRLLDADEALLIFPEGVRGINKLWPQRYQLAEFTHGFMRLALETGTPIVPIGIVGAEEQAPALWNLKHLAKLLGMPAFPITPTILPFPLPSKYYIQFGEPMTFEGDADDDSEVLDIKVQKVKEAIRALIDAGQARRDGHVFV